MRISVVAVFLAFLCEVSSNGLQKLAVVSSATDGEGLVPLPQKVQFGSIVYSLDPGVFQLDIHKSPLCDVLDSAAKRYLKILFQSGGEGKVKKFYDGESSSVSYRWLPNRQSSQNRDATMNSTAALNSLQVVVNGGKCEKYPYLGMNENCEFNSTPDS